MITLYIQCPFCGSVTELHVPFDGYMAWESGELIQNALPELSPTEREVLISNLCPDCQKDVFGEF